MACVEPNVFTFMGDHWLLTLVLALIFARGVLHPLSVFLLSVSLRIIGSERRHDSTRP